VLSEQLTELTGAGLVARSVVEGPPISVVYQLTEGGGGFDAAMRELTTWARNSPAGDRFEDCRTVSAPAIGSRFGPLAALSLFGHR
jgi:DNA-binding HxlR family transcriptional regulator